MKKVISALTAAAICASMSASVMTAFAVDAANAEFYLKAIDAGAGTISADGATVTFASAADAAGATIKIQEFLKCDTSEPYIQQIGTTFTTNSASVKLATGVDYAKKYSSEAKEYVINGQTISTNRFVSCFSGVNDVTGKWESRTDQFLWGHSDEFQFDYTGNDIVNLLWQNAKGAAFASDASDTYPFTEFSATLASDIKDGTYTVEIPDTWENKLKENPTTNGAFIDLGAGEVKVTKTKKLTIKVGDAGTVETNAPTEATKAPTDAPTEATKAPTEAPTEASTQPTTQDATEPSTPGAMTLDEKKNSQDWTWYADDVTYDPAKDTKKVGVAVQVYVTKDPGTYGYQFVPTIDGKGLVEAGFKITAAEQTEDGYEFGTFTFNEESGKIGGSNAAKENVTVDDGTSVITLYLLPPADAPAGKTYKVGIKDLLVGDFAEKKYNPATIDGSITIAGEPVQIETPEATTEAVTETQDVTEETKPVVSDAWTWYAEDVTYDPAKDTKKAGVLVNIYVDKDPGTYGYQFTPKIDGKGLVEAGFKITAAEQTEDGYEFGTFTFNEESGKIGGSNAQKENAQVADGTSVIQMYLLPPADAPAGKVYKVQIADLLVGDFAEKKYTPATRDGSITIAGEATSETDNQDTTAAQTPSDTQAPDTKPVETDKPLYGDVNVDGKVELVDIVKLNRYLCGIDKEMKGIAVVNANCYRAKGESDADTTVADLTGEDSVEILKYLIKLVSTLPTKA